MTDREVEIMLFENGLEDAGFFVNPNYAEAIIGFSQDDQVVYSYDKMIDCLVKDGMTTEDAIEWLDYNTIRAIPYMGEKPPIIVYELI